MANNKIRRKKGSFKDLLFEIDLTKYNKTGSDIDDIFFTVKNMSNEADDYLMLKKASLGQITYSGTDIITTNVQWDYNEYVNFQVGKEYIAGLFCKFNGDTVADENVNQTFLLTIEDDLLKQN